jgi:cardiolipin synthase A/B
MRRLLSILLVSLSVFFTVSVAQAEPRLLVLPDDGFIGLEKAIDQAQSNIDVVMYAFTNYDLAKALVRAHDRGIRVRVLIQHYPYKQRGENRQVIDSLRAHGVSVVWSNPRFAITHQKTMVVDQKTAYIMTFNFTRSQGARNFAIQTNDSAVIAEIERVFSADWNRQRVTESNARLVWSPMQSEHKIDELIRSAKHQIQIYNQEFGSYAMMKAMESDVARGVKVQLIVPATRYSMYRDELDAVARKGIEVKLQKHLYTHAKAMLIDYGYPDARTFVGSMNFSYSGLNKNRELGMVVHNAVVNARLHGVFQQDWLRAKALTIKPVVQASSTSCTQQQCVVHLPR